MANFSAFVMPKCYAIDAATGVHDRNDPNGIRTRVTAVKGRCPGPLDDRVVQRRANINRAATLSRQIRVCFGRQFSLACSSVGMRILIDGKFYEERDAKVSVLDHGVLYGDGVFEGIRAYN